jgi:hypothetical protein
VTRTPHRFVESRQNETSGRDQIFWLLAGSAQSGRSQRRASPQTERSSQRCLGWTEEGGDRLASPQSQRTQHHCCSPLTPAMAAPREMKEKGNGETEGKRGYINQLVRAAVTSST